MRLRTELDRFRKEWQKPDNRGNYSRANRVFGLLFAYLARQPAIPSAVQFDGLYRALRWDLKCGADAKLCVYKAGYPLRVLQAIDKDRILGSGIIGGALGSIRAKLKEKKQREIFWLMLSSVAKARTTTAADAAVKEYAKSPVSGIGISVISSFLWALKPEYYPIVNEGSLGGISAVIDGFVKVKNVETYIHRHVPRLRAVAKDMGFRSFAEFDRFIHRLTKRETIIAQQDRIPFLTADERSTATQGKGFIEGRKYEITTQVSERDSRNRRAALERGYNCEICGFSFEDIYGVRFAEVHHIKQLARGGKRHIDPAADLLVVCSNCHTMLHPSPRETLDWRTLKKAVKRRQEQG